MRFRRKSLIRLTIYKIYKFSGVGCSSKLERATNIDTEESK
jgi:hypothetical protein